MILMTLDEKRKIVDEKFSLVPKTEREFFLFNFACVFTKNSVGMESGKTSHLADVVKVIRGQNVMMEEIQKKSLWNHYKAYDDMVHYLSSFQENPPKLTEDYLKDLHSKVVDGIMNCGGMYRNVNIVIHGSNHVPCDYAKVYDKMKKYYDEIQDNQLDFLEQVSYLHLQLCKVHPFLDGNGRTARLALNYGLIRRGYVPVSIPNSRREEYFDTLEKFKIEKDIAPFKIFLMELLNAEYDRYLDLIRMYENQN